MSKSLRSINNELKSFINEASGISDKCKKKLIKLVEKHFYVDLPNDNYLNIDISILEDGNIMMREELYKTSEKIKSIDDVFERFDGFREEVQLLLEKNEVDFDKKKNNNEISNLLILGLIIFVSIIVIMFAIKRLLIGDYFGVLWLIFIVSYYIIPATNNRIRNRFIKAKNYLIKKFTKK